MDRLALAGFSEAEFCNVGYRLNEWYYGCDRTCVGKGGHDTACPPTDQSGPLYCVGTNVFGVGADQAVALYSATQQPSNVHADCPPQPPPSPPPRDAPRRRRGCGPAGGHLDGRGRKDRLLRQRGVPEALLVMPLRMTTKSRTSTG